VTLKIVQKAGYECTPEKLTNESKRKPEQKFDAAFGTTFRISKCFQRSKQKRHINVSIELGRPKIYKPFAHVQKVGTGTLATFNQSFCSASV
jgi:hypothetical protein